MRTVCDLVLRGPAHLSDAPDLRRSGCLHLLGLASGHRPGGDHPADGLHQLQGIRRARVAGRRPPGDRLDHLPAGVLRHHRQAQDQAHLCGQLVLRCVHPRDRDAAHRQQRRHAGKPVQVVLGLRRRDRRDDPVVVRPQRRGLLPDHRLPGHDVLLRTQAGRASDLLVSPVHRALLGADHPVHLGRPAPPALHRSTGLGTVPGHGHVGHPAGTELGRHDQRHDEPVRRLA